MVYSPDSIKRFLTAPVPKAPKVKGVDPDDLHDLIWRATGAAYEPVLPARPHQLEGIAYALAMRRCLLFFGVRLGKTKMALDWAAHLRKAGLWQGIGLVVAHAPVGLNVWEAEAAKHSNLKVKIARTKSDDLIAAIEADVDLLVMTWTGLHALFSQKRTSSKTGKPKLYPDDELLETASHLFDLVIIDEIQIYKNHLSLSFQILSKLVRKTRFRVGLTGTPFGRNPLDIWAESFLIDAGDTFGRSYWFFEAAFGKKVKAYGRGPNAFEIVFDKSKIDILTDKLDGLALSYQRSEIISDAVERAVVELAMGPKQRQAYLDQIEKLVRLHADEEEAIENTYIKMRQISSGYLPFTDLAGNERVLHFPDAAKGEWLAAELDDLIGTPTVIFHEYIITGELIESILAKAGLKYTTLNGRTKDKKKAVADFQDGRVDFMVANTKTGGVGIDLNRADYLLFFETTSAPIAREQAEGRPLAERNGRLLSIDDLSCSKLDQRILAGLADGKDLMHGILHARGPSVFKSLR